MISVIIPCYNQAHFLRDAVGSVVAQTCSEWEIVIVNDGSPDNCSDVARMVMREFPRSEIRLVEQRNGGLSSARNAGIAASAGEFILPLDADDMLRPTYFGKALALFERFPEIAIVYTDQEYFGARQLLVRTLEFSPRKVLFENQFAYCSMYRRRVWEAVGGYDTSFAIGSEDWNFWLGCVEKGFVARRIPEPLFLYRVREGSMWERAREHDLQLRAQLVLKHPTLFGERLVSFAESVASNEKLVPHHGGRLRVLLVRLKLHLWTAFLSGDARFILRTVRFFTRLVGRALFHSSN
ncbi:MAG: protein of unknown function, putative Glycosyl transferase [Bacteroidetes bacterium]|nr:protein of unknown function, putative Glycosyl transferase [Bacteroidota bacterium]